MAALTPHPFAWKPWRRTRDNVLDLPQPPRSKAAYPAIPPVDCTALSAEQFSAYAALARRAQVQSAALSRGEEQPLIWEWDAITPFQQLSHGLFAEVERLRQLLAQQGQQAAVSGQLAAPSPCHSVGPSGPPVAPSTDAMAIDSADQVSAVPDSAPAASAQPSAQHCASPAAQPSAPPSAPPPAPPEEQPASASQPSAPPQPRQQRQRGRRGGVRVQARRAARQSASSAPGPSVGLQAALASVERIVADTVRLVLSAAQSMAPCAAPASGRSRASGARPGDPRRLRDPRGDTRGAYPRRPAPRRSQAYRR